MFVLSTGRVGTLALSKLAGLSPKVIAVHEPPPDLLHVARDAYDAGNFGADLSKEILRLRRNAVWQAAAARKIYLETNNKLTYLAGGLDKAFPDCKFIHLFKSPWSLVRSGMERGWYASTTNPITDRRIPAPEGLPPEEKIAWLWAKINGDILEFLEDIEQERKFSLKGEWLFTGDPMVLEMLFEFLEVPVPSRSQIEAWLRVRHNTNGTASTGPWKEVELVAERLIY